MFELAPVWMGWDSCSCPRLEWERFDWAKWDKEVIPLLDGSAFQDLPREGEPVDVLYLPFNENWPVSLYEHYRPSYWADEAFTEEYKKSLRSAFAAFARHGRDNLSILFEQQAAPQGKIRWKLSTLDF